MMQNHIARGVIIVTVLGAIALLGTSCAPVSNSVPKLPTRPTQEPLPGLDRTIAPQEETFVVPQSNVMGTAHTLRPGLKEVRLNASELQQIREKKTLRLVLPDVQKEMRTYTLIGVKLSESEVNSMKLNGVRARWNISAKDTATGRPTEFTVTFEDGTKNKEKLTATLENLVSLSLHYQEIE